MIWFVFFFVVIVLALFTAAGWLLLHAALGGDARAQDAKLEPKEWNRVQ